MLNFHQSETCEGIIQHLEAREGKTRRDMRGRENGCHMAPPDARVEMTFRLGKQLYALEHTGIEPFDGFMKLQNTAAQVVEPFRTEIIGLSELAPLFDAGVMIEMVLPVDAFMPRTGFQVEDIRSALIQYVRATGPTLPIGANVRAQPVTSRPQGVPFSVTLSRFDDFPFQPPFQITFALVGSNLRDFRIERACDDKCPKLARWKQSDDVARTILVFEANDIQTTSVGAVTDAYLGVIRSRTDVPDETYMVSTHTSPWYVWPLLVDGKSYFDLSMQHSDPVHFCIDANGHLINQNQSKPDG